jgi:acetoin utilization protein AcuB
MPIRPVRDDEERRGQQAWDEAKKRKDTFSDEDKIDIKQKFKGVKYYGSKGHMVVEQVMHSPVLTLSPKDTWQAAWDVVTKKNVSHIPILLQENKLVGIVSEKDLLLLKLNSKKSLSSEDNPPIESFMRSNVISAHPSTSIRRAASVMFNEQVNAMPVIDEAQNLVGIVTQHDILRALVNHAPLKMWV